MSMRKKPDTRAFLAPKDPSAFLDGVTAEQPAQSPNRAAPSTRSTGQPKLTKIFNLSPELVQALKREAFERSNHEGRRVTETELVDAALRHYLNL
ncbi:MAG: hypothetical protein VXW65_03510 [Pseudomonadota bacterium]|nr:hypothetical protein [Pseudomonadota bacterium]